MLLKRKLIFVRKLKMLMKDGIKNLNFLIHHSKFFHVGGED
jgi:hypothetical protein